MLNWTRHKLMKSAGAMVAVAGAAMTLTSCIDTGSGGFSCSAQTAAFEQTAQAQGVLQEDAPTDGPFPMAMVLSTDAVNNLLARVLDQNLPSISQDAGGFLTVTLRPELPTVEIAQVAGCPGCILSDLNFGIDVETPLGTLSGDGAAGLSLPVALAPAGQQQTGLMAMMDEATVTNLSVEVAGLSTGDVALVEETIETLTTRYLRREFGAIEVARLDSWKLGDDDMFLAARGPTIFPEQGTMVIGLHTNLILPTATSVQEQATLPEGSQLGVQIHPDLLLTAMQRLMGVGVIAREYDGNGNADARGDHQVTLSTMRATDSEKLNTSFRIWRTGGGLCGFADISSDMSLRVNGSFVELEAENFTVDGGEGVGGILADAASTWLQGEFMNNLTDQMSLAINYRELSNDSADDQPEPQANEVIIDGRGLSVFLNLGVQE